MREKSSPLGFYTIGIAALFLLGFLLLVIFGAGVYKDTVTTQDENNQTRALRSYLVTCTRAASAEDVQLRDAAEATEGIDSQILVIRDSGTDYGLQIFLRGGELVECYGRLDMDPNPQAAQTIAATSSFAVEQIAPDAYAVTTDAGRSLLHVGSRQTAEDSFAKAGQPDASEGGGAR